MSTSQINKSLLSLYQNCLDEQEDNAHTNSELHMLGQMLKDDNTLVDKSFFRAKTILTGAKLT